MASNEIHVEDGFVLKLFKVDDVEPRCLWVMTTELTQDQLERADESYGSRLRASVPDLLGAWTLPTTDYAIDELISPDRPAMFLSLRDALQAANAVSRHYGWRPLYDIEHWDRFGEIRRVGEFGLRLPTAREWMSFAQPRVSTWDCSGGNLLDISAFSPEPRGRRDTDFFSCEDGYSLLAPSATYVPDSAGLYDTIGNVSEWTETELGPLALAWMSPALPPPVGSVVCGTSFLSGTEAMSDPFVCSGYGEAPAVQLGIRLVMTGLPEGCPK